MSDGISDGMSDGISDGMSVGIGLGIYDIKCVGLVVGLKVSVFL
jgi:hypothetical protein